MEKLIDGYDAEAAWDSACDQLRASGGDPRDLPMARRARLRFLKRADSILGLLDAEQPLSVAVEVELVSGDGKLSGRPDLVLLREADLIVADHKSGAVAVNGDAAPVYAQQVQLYAAIAAEHFGLPVARGVLLSMRQGDVDVAVDGGTITHVADAARESLDRYNELVPGAQPANARVETCRWCPYKARCDAFWAAVDSTWADEVGHCIRGVATTEVQIAANELGAVEIDVVGGTTELGRMVVAGAPASEFGGIDVGTPLAFTGMHVREGTAAARWKERSLVYIG